MALWTKTDVAGVVPKYLPVGRVLTIKVIDGGTGYSNGDAVAVTIGAPGAGGVQAVATASVVGGVVQSITVTTNGTKYATAPAISMATGAGLDAVAIIEPIIYDAQKIVFVDQTEAGLATNKSKGITSPGWWYVNSYTDNEGNVRYKTEHFIAISETAVAAGDAEDAIVPDVETTITISGQPTDQTAVAGEATFTVTAAVAPAGTLTYQWQMAVVGSTRFTNIVGATSASLALTGLVGGDSGKRYRVVVSGAGAGAGAKSVISTAATLTV